MAYINGHKVISVVRTIYQSELDLIARYHLGEYDTYQDNENGTATITRQTGYIDLGKLNNWFFSYNHFEYNGNIGAIGVSDNVLADLVCSTYETKTNSAIYAGYETGIALNGDGFIRLCDSSLNGDTSLIKGVIQYKLATSYTEQVIVNRPLNTLDQTGSQWLRSEWEKGLNLVSSNSEQLSNNDVFTANLKVGHTYTVSFDATTDGSFNITDNASSFAFWSSSQNFYSGLNSITFTLTQVDSQNKYYFLSSSTISKFMINEGDHAYPYQPYNGELIHRKDIEPVLLWENASPNADLSYVDITLGTALTNFKYFVVAYKQKQYDSISYAKFKTTSSGSTYISGIAQISGTENCVCRPFIITDSGTKMHFSNSQVIGGSGGYPTYCIPIAIYGTDVL